MKKPKILYKELSYKLVGCIYEVRYLYGSGQKEIVYQNALAESLAKAKIPYKREVSINIKSNITNKSLGKYVLDFVADDKIIVEIKAIKFTPVKIEQQIYSYLKSAKWELGYLVNFGSSMLYLKRIILTNDRKKLLV